MKFDNQLRYATVIIAAYKGDMPLHAWLKNFFRENKQMGSRDRRLVSNMVYGFYRLGHAVKDLGTEERVLTGLFLCHDAPQELLQYFKPDWDAKAAAPLADKITLCRASGIDFRPEQIFPWKEELSEGIDHEAFCLSFLRQPDLFLRIRPGYQEMVLKKLDRQTARSSVSPAPAPTAASSPDPKASSSPDPKASSSPDPTPAQLATSPATPARAYEFIPPSTLRLPNGFKVEELFTPDKEVVVQDYSSQRLAPFLQISRMQPPAAEAFPVDEASAAPRPLSFWDACAASGGKSILAYDLHPGIDITVSDIRESILHNLRHRFRQAGIGHYHAFLADLTQNIPAAAGLYDLVLADVPCSGSGTWSRTPEELYFFRPGRIGHYHDIQRKIVTNLVPTLAPGACLVYSTCSVFKRENEGIAGLIGELSGMAPDRMESILGYDQQADSMFAVRFQL